jgi:hypothetical protein
MPFVTSDNAKFTPDHGHISASDNESHLMSSGQDRPLERDSVHHQKISVVFCPFATKTRFTRAYSSQNILLLRDTSDLCHAHRTAMRKSLINNAELGSKTRTRSSCAPE